MCMEWPLSKSSTVTGCCQSSSVIINGWLFSKTPLGWSTPSCSIAVQTAVLGGGGTFQAGSPGPTSQSQSSQFAPHPAGDGWPGNRAWLAGMPCLPLRPPGG